MTGVVLVTGGSGTVGRCLVTTLRIAGRRVRALVHQRAVGADEIVAGDLRDPATAARAAAGVDVVVHLAAVTHARDPRAYDFNIDGTRTLLAAAGAGGVRRFVHVSTTAIDERGGRYSRSKAAAEAAVSGAGLEWVIVRLPEIYGAGGREGVDGIIGRARAGRPIPVVGTGSDEVCPVHVDDAVAALAAAIDAPAGRVYTLAGDCTSVREFAREVIGLTGSRSRVVSVPVAAVAVASRLARVVPLPLYPDQLARLRAPKSRDAASARADLGFAPRSLRDGLATEVES